MSLVNVHSQVALGSFSGEATPQKAYLSNPAKQVYQLNILELRPQDLRIRLAPPRGRRTPLDPLDDWTLLLRNDQGAYQAKLVKLVPEEDALVCILPDRMRFLARRKYIRLAAESRARIRVDFQHKDHHHQGRLVDFSLEGLGISVPADDHWSQGEEIHKGHFELRGHQVRFDKARIAHCRTESGQVRLGVHFTALAPGQAQIIRDTFDAWYFSQRPSFSGSNELDG